MEAAALGGPRARARAVAPHQPGGGARGRGGARAAAGDCQLSAEVRIEVTGYVFTKYHHLHCDHGLYVCSLTSTWRGVCRPGSGSRGGAGPGSPASPRPAGRTAAARSTGPAPGQYLDIYTVYRYTHLATPPAVLPAAAHLPAGHAQLAAEPAHHRPRVAQQAGF